MVRPPAVAGLFYPADRGELTSLIERLLDEAPARGLTPKALIAPHAGYRYSGPIAASAYRELGGLRGQVERVVLVGPSHRVPFEGVALPMADVFATPLGEVPVDDETNALLRELPGVVVDDLPHAAEHSLEVHLPFVQRMLGDGISVVPLAVGHAEASTVAHVVEHCWGGSETVVVVSSDLSHYADHATARRLDAVTAATIEALRADDLGPRSACGARAVAGLLVVGRERGLGVERLDLRTSGDTSGERDRVVGYGAWAFLEPPGPRESMGANTVVEHGTD